jgi:hypothetical protein
MLTTTLDALALTMDVPMHSPEFQHLVDEAPAMIGEKRKAAEPAEADGEESKKRSNVKVEEKIVERRAWEAGRRKKTTGRRRKRTTLVEDGQGVVM